MNKTQLTAVEGWAAKDKILATQLKLILYPLYATKPDKLSLACLVCNVDYKTLISPLAKVVLARHATTNLDIATRGISLVQLSDIVNFRAVNIAKWEVVEHIAHCAHTNLLCK